MEGTEQKAKDLLLTCGSYVTACLVIKVIIMPTLGSDGDIEYWKEVLNHLETIFANMPVPNPIEQKNSENKNIINI